MKTMSEIIRATRMRDEVQRRIKIVDIPTEPLSWVIIEYRPKACKLWRHSSASLVISYERKDSKK